MDKNERDQLRQDLVDDYRGDPDAQADIIAGLVASGDISPELGAAMVDGSRLCAEPCPTCHVGRGHWCNDLEGRTTTLRHVDRMARN